MFFTFLIVFLWCCVKNLSTFSWFSDLDIYLKPSCLSSRFNSFKIKPQVKFRSTSNNISFSFLIKVILANKFPQIIFLNTNLNKFWSCSNDAERSIDASYVSSDILEGTLPILKAFKTFSLQQYMRLMLIY